MKAIKCMLAVNTANGHICVQRHFDSISQAVKVGRESCGFAYRVFVDCKVVRRGFCKQL